MRTFPRASRLAAALACAVAGSVLISSGGPSLADDHAKPHLQQQQRSVQQQEKSAQHDLDESSADLRAATTRLATAQSRLTAARAKVASTTAQLQQAQTAHAKVQTALVAQRKRLTVARAQLAEGQRAVDDQRGAMRDEILSRFTGGDPSLSQAAELLTGGSVEDLMRQQSYADAAGASKDADLQRLEATETLLVVHKNQVRTVTEQVAAQEKQAQALVEQMAQLQQQAQEAQAAVATLVTQAAAAKAAAATAQAQDATELRKLKSQDDALRQKIQALSRRAASRSVGSTSGLFLAPVAGSYVTSPYGWRKHPIYGYWGLHNGADLHAPCGTPLHAVDSGRIISTYYSSVWGNRLFVYLGKVNGHSYTAVYNHISRYRVRSGSVARGQVVAYAGTTGWSTACHLHFTILRDGNPVDPVPLMKG